MVAAATNPRCEPRFQIKTNANLTVLDTHEPPSECQLVDISRSGVSFLTRENLPVGRVIGLDFRDQLVLAKVRNLEPRGDRYAIGAAQIHLVNKMDLPDSNTGIEQIWEAMKAPHEAKRKQPGEPAEVTDADARSLKSLSNLKMPAPVGPPRRPHHPRSGLPCWFKVISSPPAGIRPKKGCGALRALPRSQR